ncbi:unnamed protein product [Clonostachys byssicola]|uniref:Uncharacterized protein n=1 Tax=Clonostachys byssicola TaxID=160290 RepID=A0A9N9UC87_9HYPO|nr:unnamed protein product [Clonostachys byssicola]
MEEEEAMSKRRSSVFHSGIWYPEMPGITTNLNEKYAMLPYDFYPTQKGEAVSGSRYLPLCFIRFASQDGQILGSLSTVRGKLSTAITFTYESDDSPLVEVSWPRGYGYRSMEDPSFQIDGKGGERFVQAIFKVEGNLKSNEEPLVHGVLSSAILLTDRGRECELCNYGRQYDGVFNTIELRLHPLETITGIYGVPGGMFLGIVSEKANDTPP